MTFVHLNQIATSFGLAIVMLYDPETMWLLFYRLRP